MADYNIFNSGKTGTEVNEAVSAMTVVVDTLPTASQVSLSNKIYIRRSDNSMWHVQGGSWVELGTGTTTSIAGKSGAITTGNANGTNGTIAMSNSKVMTVQSIPYQNGITGARPSGANTAGGMIPVICPSNQSTSEMYAGYIYILVEEVTA